jgi:hypothetical protein
MTDQYYGYTPYQLPSSVAQYDDYTAAMGTVDYQPTDWDSDRTTIDLMWPWIQIDSDARATALADMWRRVYTLLDHTGNNLRRYTDALADKWKSDAAKVFLGEVGATLASIDEWKEVATTNATGLDVMASTIAWNQKNALRIWNEYCMAINHPGSVAGSAPTQAGRKAQPEAEDKRKERLVKHYTEQIKPYVKEVGETYLLVYFNYLTWGTRFKGPTNAAVAVPPTMHAGGPGGSMPAPPILPPPVFPKHDLPDPSQLEGQLAQLGVLPTVGDHSLTLAGTTGLPVLPPLPELPTVTGPAPGSPSLHAMPGLPGLPGVSRGGLPGGLDPSRMNARPAGEQGGLRPPMPGRPNLSGMRPPPGGGARPPMPGRGNPNLRGAKGRLPGAAGPDLSEETPRPGGPRAPMPPRLGGRRAGGPAGHMGPESDRMGGRGLPPGGHGPARPGAPGERLTGRRGPAGGPLEEQEEFNRRLSLRPTLEGRGGVTHPAGPMAADDAGHSPALRGRNVDPARGQQPGHGRDQQHPAQPQTAHETTVVAGEDELWAVERPNPTVIDTPQAPPPSTQGPAIGR